MSVGSAARRPARYARSNPIPAALILFAGTSGLLFVNRGRQPTQKELASLAIGAGVVVVSASVVPELATAVLIALFVASTLQNDSFVLTLADQASRALG